MAAGLNDGERTLTAPMPDPEAPKGQTARPPRLDRIAMPWLRSAYEALSLPVLVLFLFYNRRIHPSYGMSWPAKFKLALRMWRNTRRVPTGTSYKAHLAMAVKLLEIAPKTKGVVVECGCWQGGSTVNISLICDIVGRRLVVYDSFEGLPAAEPNDRYANPFTEGYFAADLDRVKENVRRYGKINCCEFRKGWFKDTLPAHREPIVLCFLDVDYQSSLHDCVVNLWPHLTSRGYVFIDEFTRLDYCALFFSERFWTDHFDTAPPGLMGTGTGVGVGQYFLGPLAGRPIIQAPTSLAYTRKDFYSRWDYTPGSESQPS
jgi:O-methyltransferase